MKCHLWKKKDEDEMSFMEKKMMNMKCHVEE